MLTPCVSSRRLERKDGAADAEDRVTIDFTGSVDGEESSKAAKRPISFWRWALVRFRALKTALKASQRQEVHYRCDPSGRVPR